MPFISICIPAYKNIDFLKRLLQSISEQTYKDFEVIISDDSPNETIKYLLHQYQNIFNITYHKNKLPLGSPANWNFAISKASGKWIKLMHHDDWFANENSLLYFAETAQKHDYNSIIFSGFFEIKNGEKISRYVISENEKRLLNKSPLNLFKKNFIGHPSTSLIKNNIAKWYDDKIKWVVDFEFYIRYLKKSSFIAIDAALINIGVHDEQVTKLAFRNPEIEIPENLYLLNKIGYSSMKNIFVYDYYWRLFRNLEIRSLGGIESYSKSDIPLVLKKMLRIQFRIPLFILKIGIFSKFFMLIARLSART